MMSSRWRLGIEVSRIDPITVKKDHLVLLRDQEVIWDGEANDAGLQNVLPHFASIRVLDSEVDESDGVELMLILVNDKSKKKAKVQAVKNLVASVAANLPAIPIPGVGRLAPGMVLQSALKVADVFAKADWHDVLGGVFIKAVPSSEGLVVMVSARNEKFPLLRLDDDDNPSIDEALHWESETLQTGEQLRVMTACHEDGRCRVHLYLRIFVRDDVR